MTDEAAKPDAGALQADPKADPRSEASFFARERAPSELRRVPQPPSTARRVGVGAGVVLLLGAVLWFFRTGDMATLWVVNPGPGAVTIEMGRQREVLEPGKMLDLQVPARLGVEVLVHRGQTTDPIDVDLRPNTGEVAIIDLGGGDGAYAVVDASSQFGAGGSEPPQVVHISKPHNVHYLPFPALQLVRPGRRLPEKDSWAITAQGATKILKVFRIEGRRLADEARLKEMLVEAIKAKDATQYENMTTTSTGGLAPVALPK